MKKFFFGALVLILMAACTPMQDENDMMSDYISIATVENPDSIAGFYFTLDNNDKMWVTSTPFPDYRPRTGQRIIASYNILTVNDYSTLYNHKVKLTDVYQVLTKNIFNINSTTQDSIGNDPITVRDMWIGSHYLNVEFLYYGYNKIHFINLVADTSKTYTDGKVHLEFRHNDNNDYPQYSKWGVASFDISSLKSVAVGDSVNLVIHATGYNTPSASTYQLTYKFGSAAGAPVLKRMSQATLQSAKGISK